MKKMISYILAVFLLLQTVPITYAQRDQASKISSKDMRAKQLLNIIGITLTTENELVSRGEFASLVSQLMPDIKKSSVEVSSFSDISDYYIYKNEIETMKMQNLMIGYGGRFDANAKILLQDALRVLVKAAGYGEYAQRKGGSTADYINIARTLGITKGVAGNYSEGFDAAAAYRLAFNLLNVREFEVSGITDRENILYEQSDETYGKKHFGLIEVRGNVTANSVSALAGYNAAPDNMVMIGNVPYRYSINGLSELIGLPVYGYARETAEDEYEIIYFELDDKKDIVKANIEDVSSAAGFDFTDSAASKAHPEITYFSESGNASTVTLGGELQVAYNGALTTDISNSDFTNDFGYIYFADTNDDGTYDFVSISAYKSYVVDRVDTEGKIILFKYGMGSLECKDKEISEITNESRTIDIGSLRAEVAVSIRAAKTASGKISDSPVIYIDMSTDTVTGSVDAIDYSGQEAEINGRIYKYDRSIENKMLRNIVYKYNLDIFGRICGVEKIDEEEGKYYFLVNYYAKDGLKSKFQLRFIDMNKNELIFTLTDKIIYTGPDETGKWIVKQRIDKKRAGKIFDNNFKGIRRLFKLTITEDGNIDSMIAPLDNTATEGYAGYSDEFSLDRRVKAEEKAAHDYCIDSVYRFNSGTTVIVNNANGSAEDIKIMKTSQKINVTMRKEAADDPSTPEDESYPGDYLEIYNSTSDLYAGIIVANIGASFINTTWTRWDTAIFVVDTVKWAKNEDDEAVPFLSGYYNNMYKSFYSADDSVENCYTGNGFTQYSYKTKITELSKGDVIIPNINNDGEIDSFISLFTVRNGEFPTDARYSCGDLTFDWGHTTVGYYDEIGNIYEKTFTLKSKPSKIIPLSGNIFLYDINEKSIKRVAPESIYGLLRDSDRVFVHQRRSQQVSMVIYRQ